LHGADRAAIRHLAGKKDPAHRAAFEQLQSLVVALRNEGVAPMCAHYAIAALRITKQSRSHKFTFAVAASVAALAVAATMWTTLS